MLLSQDLAAVHKFSPQESGVLHWLHYPGARVDNPPHTKKPQRQRSIIQRVSPSFTRGNQHAGNDFPCLVLHALAFPCAQEPGFLLFFR
jgi:hypothetical protein